LQERTGQLEEASNTIIERNEELTKTREIVTEKDKIIEDLQKEIQ
jgi:hypothetical protein